MALLDRVRARRGRAAGPDDETVALAREDFARRQRSRRWRRVRPWLLVAAILVAAGAGTWLIWFSSVMTVTEVEVTGNQSLSAARIEHVAKVPMQRQLARVDLSSIRARVENIPAVDTADVSRSWPHAVHIEVTERTPVAVVDRGTGGRLQAVDDDGVLFGSYPKRPESLPLVRTDPEVSAETLAEAALVIGSLPAEVVTRVNFLDVGSVDHIELVLHDGRKVLWGSAEESPQKAEVLAVLLKRKAGEYDVSVPGRPTSR